MIKSRKAARLYARISSIFAVIPLVEVFVNRSAYSITLLFLVAVPFFLIKCKNCSTKIYDHRIAGYVKGFDLEVLDKCPVCSKQMLD